MLAVKIVLTALSAVVVLQTALSLVRSRKWWVRIFDFPRAQIASASVLLLALFGWTNVGFEEAKLWERVLFGLLGLAVLIQGRQMLPYTRLWKRQVPDAPRGAGGGDRLRIVISNVLMENRQHARWLEIVCAEKPDIIVAVEVDEAWDRALQALEKSHPHAICQPQNNTYGMAIYSRRPLHGTKVKHLVESDVPSIFTSVELSSGRRVRCAIVHPRPPRPDIQQDSALRDAELVRAARIVSAFETPMIVAGDLNDVAWSHTTHLFQRLARLLDPRVGRGLFATYHADHRLLRYPLDHVFLSKQFDLVELRRLAHVGSDHFPVLVEVLLRANDPDRPNVEPAGIAAEERAIDAVEDVRELKRNETREERRRRKKADR